MSYRYAARYLAGLFPLTGYAHPERIRRTTIATRVIPRKTPGVGKYRFGRVV